MKLPITLNLEPLRQQVLATIDTFYVAKVPDVSPLRRAKLELAQNEPNHPALIEEAQLRNIAVEKLCMDILSAASTNSDELVSIELERQRAKALVKQATSEHTLLNLLRTYQV